MRIATRPAVLSGALALLVSLALSSTATVRASRLEMPVAEQNALVQKYCAVCHTDRAQNGGLTLQHFDAATAAPDLAAMMVSKVTSGVALATIRAAETDARAAVIMAEKMKGGAMNAAGIPPPPDATVNALAFALAKAATGAEEWSVSRSVDSNTATPIVTASILRELPSAHAGEASMYRLVIECRTAERAGNVQLAWAPVPANGRFDVASDDAPIVPYEVVGKEQMGNGSAATTGRAHQRLAPVLPRRTLRVSGLFPNQAVTFAFDALPDAARQSFAACFMPAGSAPR